MDDWYTRARENLANMPHGPLGCRYGVIIRIDEVLLRDRARSAMGLIVDGFRSTITGKLKPVTTDEVIRTVNTRTGECTITRALYILNEDEMEALISSIITAARAAGEAGDHVRLEQQSDIWRRRPDSLADIDAAAQAEYEAAMARTHARGTLTSSDEVPDEPGHEG